MLKFELRTPMVVPNIPRKFGADWLRHLGGDSPPPDRLPTGIPPNLSRAHIMHVILFFPLFIPNCAAIAAQFD